MARKNRAGRLALGNLARAGFAGLVVGLAGAVLLSRWIWLEMRVDVGLLVPVAALCALSAAVVTGRSPAGTTLVALEALALVVLLVVFRKDLGALWVIPACLLREAWRVDSPALPYVNAGIALALVFGNGLWVGPWVRRRGRG